MEMNNSKDQVEKAGVEKACMLNPLFEEAIGLTRGLFFDPSKTAALPKQSDEINCQIKTHQDAVDAANKALETIGDPYTYVSSREKRAELEKGTFEDSPYVGIGLHILRPKERDKPATNSENSVVEAVFPGGPADKAGLKPGDIIKSIDGKSTNGLTRPQIWDLIDGKENTKALLKVDRDGKMLDLSPIRSKVEEPAIISQVVDNDVLYIKIRDFMKGNVEVDIRQALENHPKASALIIDLRNNRGGRLDELLETVPLFMQSGTLYYKDEADTDSTETRISTGRVELRDNDIREITPSGDTIITERNPNLTGEKPIVILANGRSASASEMFIGALSDNNRAKVVGETTFGKGIGQSDLPLPDGALLTVTIGSYRTPSGRWPGDANKNRFGILPDIEVKQDPRYVPLSSADKQFQKALETVRAMAKPNP
ncbi:MAG: S41 family peptidase [Candidatus Melainabacteria bacterium]|nr:S41 family peptidase [Candidatus Melainabacteria bacterium]